MPYVKCSKNYHRRTLSSSSVTVPSLLMSMTSKKALLSCSWKVFSPLRCRSSSSCAKLFKPCKNFSFVISIPGFRPIATQNFFSCSLKFVISESVALHKSRIFSAYCKNSSMSTVPVLSTSTVSKYAPIRFTHTGFLVRSTAILRRLKRASVPVLSQGRCPRLAWFTELNDSK